MVIYQEGIREPLDHKKRILWDGLSSFLLLQARPRPPVPQSGESGNMKYSCTIISPALPLVCPAESVYLPSYFFYPCCFNTNISLKCTFFISTNNSNINNNTKTANNNDSTSEFFKLYCLSELKVTNI